tara:strand:+ start:31403 stop:32035 length:633 start_codon:yes stop_codon:yes gene_type:complete
MDKELKQTERKFQSTCYQWFYNTFPHLRGLLYHVPNGEKRDPITANLLKGAGVVAGIPDLVFHYRSRTYFFELKNEDGKGRLSKEQIKIHEQLDEQRFLLWVVSDFDSFKFLIESIINDRSEQFTHGITKENYFYKHKIYEYLYNMGDAEVVKIDDICNDETRTRFLNYIMDFMSEGFDKLDNFEILFTPDYKAFYKKIKGSDKIINYGN